VQERVVTNRRVVAGSVVEPKSRYSNGGVEVADVESKRRLSKGGVAYAGYVVQKR